MTNLSPHPPSMYATLSDGRFDGDGIDEVWSRPAQPPIAPKVRVLVDTKATRRAYKQRYRIEHRDNYLSQKRADSRNRRATKRKAGGVVTVRQWADMLEIYGNTCLCCGVSSVPMTQDHVLPVSMGGSNTIDNLQPLCAMCNSLKGTKHIDYR